jgi:cysteine-rich repeat protein
MLDFLDGWGTLNPRILLFTIGLVLQASSCGRTELGDGADGGPDAVPDHVEEPAVPPPECGNGILEGDEECDDGNGDDSDSCLSDCRGASCGDGHVRTGHEECDGVDLDGRDCRALGFTGGALECTGGCAFDTANCTLCGNGIVEPDEECDDSNDVRWDGCNDCSIVEFMVNVGMDYETESNSVAMAPDGRFVVVWDYDHERGLSSDYNVYALLYDPAGTPFGTSFQVNTYFPRGQKNPSVSMDEGGRFVVTWQSYEQDLERGWAIIGRRFDELGEALSSEFQVTGTESGDQENPRIAMLADGRFWTTWFRWGTRYPDYHRGLFAQRFDSLASPVGSEFQVNVHAVDSGCRPSIALAPDGSGVACWGGQIIPGPEEEVACTLYDPAGDPWSREIRINEFATDQQFHTSVSMAGDGSFVVVWESEGQDTSYSGIYGRLMHADGTPVGPEFRINQVYLGDQMFPSMAMAPDGGFVVVWESEDQDGDGFGIFARRYDASGLPLGDEFQVNVHAQGDQDSVSVAMDARGRFVVVWASSSPPEQDGIYAQRFDASGNPLGMLPW